MIPITRVDEIPQEGEVVIFVLVDNRAPCKKFINNSNQAIAILEDGNQPRGASYYFLMWNNIVKEELNLNGMPTTIVYVDGVEKKRFVGHFYSHFEIANMISEGVNK